MLRQGAEMWMHGLESHGSTGTAVAKRQERWIRLTNAIKVWGSLDFLGGYIPVVGFLI